MGNHVLGAGFMTKPSCWRTTAARGSTDLERDAASRATMQPQLIYARHVTSTLTNTRAVTLWSEVRSFWHAAY